MTDLEKVIKGFECCHVMVHDLGPDKTSCGICPYKDVQTEEQIDLGGIECIAVLHDDALAMLKEQPELVHCGECKYRSKEMYDYYGNPNDKRYVCQIHDLAKKPDWFCGDGERR